MIPKEIPKEFMINYTKLKEEVRERAARKDARIVKILIDSRRVHIYGLKWDRFRLREVFYYNISCIRLDSIKHTAEVIRDMVEMFESMGYELKREKVEWYEAVFEFVLKN